MDALSPTPAPTPAEPKGPHLGHKVWEHSKPTLERVWLHLRVWMQWMATPEFRNRLVTYQSKPYCDEGQWKVALPKQCVVCGKEEGLQPKAYDRTIRHFETPASFVGASLGGFFLFFFLSIFLWGPLFWVALLCLAGNIALYFKSWPEEVDLSTYACAEHAESMVCPELIASDEKLCVVLPSAKVAEAARLEIRAQRAARQPGGPQRQADARETRDPIQRKPPGSVPLDSGTGASSGNSSEQLPRRGELPPIKLD
ncbi:MAG: hypothetical protein JSS27_20580 [Planctomycetes bacterium]|nr:hypothetical protein [Planctomycetota bacterium]